MPFFVHIIFSNTCMVGRYYSSILLLDPCVSCVLNRQETAQFSKNNTGHYFLFCSFGFFFLPTTVVWVLQSEILDLFIRFRDNLAFTWANIIYCDIHWTKYKIRMRMFSTVLVETRYVYYHNFTIKTSSFIDKTCIEIL